MIPEAIFFLALMVVMAGAFWFFKPSAAELKERTARKRIKQQYDTDRHARDKDHELALKEYELRSQAIEAAHEERLALIDAVTAPETADCERSPDEQIADLVGVLDSYDENARIRTVSGDIDWELGSGDPVRVEVWD